jgi:hypothetical protein
VVVPNARIVSSFNTVPSEVLFSVFASRRLSRRPSLLYCGDDAKAKTVAARLIHDVGLEPVDVGPRCGRQRALATLGALLPGCRRVEARVDAQFRLLAVQPFEARFPLAIGDHQKLGRRSAVEHAVRERFRDGHPLRQMFRERSRRFAESCRDEP